MIYSNRSWAVLPDSSQTGGDMKRLFTALIAVSAALQLAAQTIPLSEIGKPDIPSGVPDSLHRFDLTFDYSIFNRPYADLYDFTPQDALRLETVGPNVVPFFYAKLGLQYPVIPTAEFYFQTKPKKGFGMGFYANHSSFVGKRPDVVTGSDIDNFRMNNSVGGAITYDWETGEFMMDAQYNYDRHFFDAGTANSLSKNRNILLSMNINSAYVEEKSLFYDITVRYKNTVLGEERTASVIKGVTENFFKLKGTVGSTFDIHRINVDMNIELATYANMKDYTVGVVELAPSYEIDRPWLKARIGARFGTTYGISGDDAQEDIGVENNIFPDIDARFTLVDKSLWIRTVVTGGEDLNNMSELARRCPVVDLLTDTRFGVRQVDTRLSLESVIIGRLSFNLLGSFMLYSDKLYFAPVMNGGPLSRIQASYMDVRQFSYGFETFFKSQDFTVGGKMEMHSYADRDEAAAEVTQFPKITANAFLRYSFRERLIASVDLSYRSKVSGNAFGEYEVPSILNANFNVNYLLNRHISVYLKCGNIFDKRNQYMPMYLEPGRNYGGGVCVTF